MEAHVFFIQLVLILFSARVLGELAVYFKLPSVIGELLAGIIIGPSLFNLIEITPSITLLAQIGIMLLLFEVGLDTDISRLSSAGLRASIVAVGGFILPFIFGFSISYYLFHFALLVSLFIGSTLTATSIGITLRVLRDLKKQNRPEAQIILGAAVLDDIMGIVLLALLYEFSMGGTVDLWNAVTILTNILLYFVISPLVAKILFLSIEKWDKKSSTPGLIPTTVVALILLFGWIAHNLGAPELLGGFTAGLALSRHFLLPFAPFRHKAPEFSHRVEEQMKPIIHLFTPIFFVVIGLSLNLQSINWGSPFIWLLTGSLATVAILGKFLSGFLLKNERFKEKLAIGLAMIPRGEVGLIFANIGLTAGVLKGDIYASIILVIALTTLLAPFFLRCLYGPADTEDEKLIVS